MPNIASGTPATSRHSTAAGARITARSSPCSQRIPTRAEGGDEVGDVEGHQAREHGRHRDAALDPAPPERADHEQAAAHAGGRERLIGEELREAEGQEAPGRARDSVPHQRALPDRGRTHVGERLEHHRRQQPDRLRSRQQPRERLLLGAVHDDEHEHGEQERAAEPGEAGGRVGAGDVGSAHVAGNVSLREGSPQIASSSSTPTGAWSEPRTVRSMKAPRTKRIASGEAST